MISQRRQTKYAVAAVIGSVLLGLGAASAQAGLPDPWPLDVNCATTAKSDVDFLRGANCRQTRIGGSARRYVAWYPRKAQRRVERGRRVGVVVMLHGSSGTGEDFFNNSGWREKASREGFVAVFPTSAEYLLDVGRTSTRWAAYNLEDEIDEAVTPPVDDVRFLRAMLTDVTRSTSVDPGRIYLSGFSNGGNMCMRAAMEMTRGIAAFGCNAGSVGLGGHTVTAGNPHSPVMFTFGNEDRNLLPAVQAEDPSVTEVPMDPGAAFAYQAVRGLVGLQLNALGLGLDSDVLIRNPEIFDIRFDESLPGVDGSELQFVLLYELGHKYPTPTNNPNEFSMADLLWTFFERHRR